MVFVRYRPATHALQRESPVPVHDICSAQPGTEVHAWQTVAGPWLLGKNPGRHSAQSESPALLQVTGKLQLVTGVHWGQVEAGPGVFDR